jgi:polar amino acid transport system substrate-binding protein
MRSLRSALALATTVALLAACAPADEGAPAVGDADALPTVQEGVLTIGTSDPGYEPWIVDNDPTSGEGFESAVAYAVAEELGFSEDQVEWVAVTFDQIIAPGEKDFDFAINQVSITEERRANLDFSSSYYDTAQAVVTLEDSPAADAGSLAELKDLRIGAMVGSTSARVAEDVIAPTTSVQQFNDNDQVKQALTSGLVDAIVVDLPTALYISAVELDGGLIVGQLPAGESPDRFGLVLDKGSPLTERVTAAVDALREDGTLAEIESRWLTDTAGAPVLE